MHWGPPFQRRRIGIRGRIIKSMLSNCSEMFFLGTHWTTWYSMVSELACTIDHKMDQSLWQTIISFDIFAFIIHVNTNSIVMWVILLSSTVSRLRFCGRPWGFKIYFSFRAYSEATRSFPSVGCVRNKLQFRTVQQNQKSFLWMQDWREEGDLLMNKREVRSPRHTIPKRKQSRRVINDLDNVDFIPSNVRSSHQEALYVLGDNEGVIKMIINWRSPTMRHVSRTHRVALDWLFDRINLDPKSNTLIPKTNSKTYWPKETSHEMNGIIFCVCLTSAVSVLQIVLEWCRKERKKIQVKKESQQNRSRWWI